MSKCCHLFLRQRLEKPLPTQELSWLSIEILCSGMAVGLWGLIRQFKALEAAVSLLKYAIILPIK